MKIKPKIIARVLMIAVILGFFAADLVSLNINKIWPILMAMILILIIIAWVFRDKIISLTVLTGIFFVLTYAFGASLISSHQPSEGLRNQTEIEGVISEKPALDDKQKIVLSVKDNNKNIFILVNLSRYPEYVYGQKLKITGKLEKPIIFPDFNYRNYLKGKQIYVVMNRANKIEITGNGGSKVKSWLYDFGTKFEQALNRSLPEPEASFAAGLLVGSKRGLPDSLITAMQTTGTSHLVAISGFNVTVIVLALSYLFFLLGRRNGFVLSCLVIIGIIILTGGSASVVRGGIVALLALFAKIIDRRTDQTNILLLSAVMLLTANPLMLLYDYGFLLSFTAFAGLVYISPIIEYFFIHKKLLSKIPQLIAGPLKETFAAQIMTLPLLLFGFGKFSTIAPLTNVLILPLVPITMFFALLVGLFGMIERHLGIFAGYVVWGALAYPLKIIDWFSHFKFAAFDFGKNILWLLVLLYVVIIFLIILSRREQKNVQGY